jgi:Protein of unknown function (DUF5672)
MPVAPKHPESLRIWEDTLRSIEPPPPEKTRWATGQVPYVAAIVEPRRHADLQAILYNMAHVYGGKPDWGLVIFHGTENSTFVREIIDGWIGVHFVNIQTANLTIPAYCRLLTSAVFWDIIATWGQSHALIFQTDTILRRAIDSDFFQYSYVGAPWPWSPSRKCICFVGNGGLSLRHIATMRRISQEHGPVTGTEDATHEDVFFAEHLVGSVPSVGDASRFSVEHIPHADPCGIHQAYLFHSPTYIRLWLRNIPGIPTQ